MFKSFVQELLTEFSSMKYQLVFVATVLFYIDKLSESGWITFVLAITGIRVANEFAGMFKDVQTAKNQFKLDSKKEDKNDSAE